MADFSRWAQRRGGGHRQDPDRPAPAAPTLPLPPQGYAWGYQAGQYILIPLQAQPPQPAQPQQQPQYVPPPRQPQGMQPFVPQPLGGSFPPGHATQRVETCLLVKPDARDTYADLLSTLPDLVPPDERYNAMEGRISPETLAAVGNIPELIETPPAAPEKPVGNPEQLRRAFAGSGQLIRGSQPIPGAS